MADKVPFDVIVIGAGVEGSATAYQLTKLAGKKRIALVEQVLTACGVCWESAVRGSDLSLLHTSWLDMAYCSIEIV